MHGNSDIKFQYEIYPNFSVQTGVTLLILYVFCMIHSISSDFVPGHHTVEMRCTQHILEIHCTLCEVGTEVFGARGGAVGCGTAPQARRLQVRFPMVSLEFFVDIILLAALWPWGWLSLQQEWVPGIFSGGKGGWCIGLTTLPPSCADCLEIWEPQTPGTLRASPGL